MYETISLHQYRRSRTSPIMFSKDDLLVGCKWAAAACAVWFGGLSVPVQALAWFILIDGVSGILASLKEGRGLSSSAGGFGVFKKLAMLIMLFSIQRFEGTLHHDLGLVNIVAILFAITEAISICENCARMNPDSVPPGFLDALYILKKAQRLTILTRVNRAMAVFFGVEAYDVERGKELPLPESTASQPAAKPDVKS